jgi:hypothetical protein
MTPKTIYNLVIIGTAAVLLIGPSLYAITRVDAALELIPGRYDTSAVAVPRGALAAARERVDAASLALSLGDKTGARNALDDLADMIGAMDCHTDAECERLHGADDEEQEKRT